MTDTRSDGHWLVPRVRGVVQNARSLHKKQAKTGCNALRGTSDPLINEAMVNMKLKVAAASWSSWLLLPPFCAKMPSIR
jgi:hypothetical protein